MSLLRADQPWQADATNEAVVEGIKRCEAGIRLHTRPSVVYNDVPFALLFIAGAAPRVLVHIPVVQVVMLAHGTSTPNCATHGSLGSRMWRSSACSCCALWSQLQD